MIQAYLYKERIMNIKIVSQAFLLSSLFAFTSASAASLTAAAVATTEAASCPSFLKQTMRKLHAKESVDLCQLTAGKAVLMVNTASHCGFTPQFKGLEALHKKYQDQGLVVIGFPSDDFFQEEDNEKATADICFVNYGVTFTMLETTAVRGDDSNAVFKHLAEQTTAPKWNFYKYLVSADGKNISHFNSKVKPTDKAFISQVEAALAAK